VYAYQQNYSAAIDWYKKALDLDPQYEIALANMGNCYAELKQYDEALKIYQKILQINPNNQQARSNIEITNKILGESANPNKVSPKK